MNARTVTLNDKNVLENEILELLMDPLTPNDVYSRLKIRGYNVKLNEVKEKLEELRKRGLVEKDDKGVYKLKRAISQDSNDILAVNNIPNVKILSNLTVDNSNTIFAVSIERIEPEIIIDHVALEILKELYGKQGVNDLNTIFMLAYNEVTDMFEFEGIPYIKGEKRFFDKRLIVYDYIDGPFPSRHFKAAFRIS